jgi:DNA replication protein DnaC
MEGVDAVMRAAEAVRSARTDAEVTAFQLRERKLANEAAVKSLTESLGIPPKEALLIVEGHDRLGIPWRETRASQALEAELPKALVVLLTGPVGTGKSSAACRELARMCQASIVHQDGTIEAVNVWGDGVYLRAPDFARVADWDERTLRSIWEARNLVIDDLGEERELGEKATGKLRTLLSRRDDEITNTTRTIITTNLSLKEIQRRYQARIWDRLRELAVVVNVNDQVRPRKSEQRP